MRIDNLFCNKLDVSELYVGRTLLYAAFDFEVAGGS